MTAEERRNSFISNMSMHVAMQVTGAALKKSFDKVYGKLALGIIEREGGKLEDMAIEFQELQTSIAKESMNVLRSGEITVLYLEYVQRFYETQNNLFEEIRKKADPSGIAELEASKAEVNKAYADLMLKIQLRQAMLGLVVPKTVLESKTFRLESNNRVHLSEADLPQIQKLIEENKGKFEQIKNADGSFVPGEYIADMDGKTLIFVAEKTTQLGPQARIRGRVEIENYDWEKTKEEFGSDGSLKQNELLSEAWNEKWRPGQPVPEKYKQELYKLKLEDYTNKAVKEGLTREQAKLSYEALSKNSDKSPIQDSNDLDVLYEEAAVAKIELDLLTKDLASETGGTAKPRSEETNRGLKDRERAEEKVNGEYRGDASKLVDIAGSKIVYKTLGEVYTALNYITGKLTNIVRVKDRFVSPTPGGYRDILINLKMSNGHYVELRLSTEAMEIADKPGHKLYENVRSINDKAKAEKRVLTKDEKIMVENLNASAKKLYDQAWSELVKQNKSNGN